MLIVYLLILRFIHIVASVCWAGGAFVFFLFIEPTAKDLAPTGIQFIQHMVNKRRYSNFMVISSTATVLSGALLLWQVAGSQWIAYLRTGAGLGFVLGSVVGAMVYLVGMFGVRPRAERISEIGAEIQAAGGTPTPEQGAEMKKIDKEMSILGFADFLLVALSLGLMATARYWII